VQTIRANFNYLLLQLMVVDNIETDVAYEATLHAISLFCLLYLQFELS